MRLQRNQQLTWKELARANLRGTTLEWTPKVGLPYKTEVHAIRIKNRFGTESLLIEDSSGRPPISRPLYGPNDGPKVEEGNRLSFGIRNVGHGFLTIPED